MIPIVRDFHSQVTYAHLALFRLKRVNFNIQPECHALLKSVCALKGVTVSDYIYDLLGKDFEELVRTDEQVRQMFLSGNYRVGSRVQTLKSKIENE